MNSDRGLLPRFALLASLVLTVTTAARADTAFSQNFDTGPGVALGADSYWASNSNDNGFIVKTNVPSGFAGSPITNDASGSGYFLFDGTLGTPVGTVIYSASFAVTPNTNYEVSFDLTNANTINVAAIQPEIGGLLLGSPVSAAGAFSSGQEWQNFTFDWNSGSLTSTSLILHDSTATDQGNDFGVDNIVVSSAVPEPSSLVLAGVATAAGLGAWARRRWRSSRRG